MRLLPSVRAVLDHASVRPLVGEFGRELVLGRVRHELDAARGWLENGSDRESLLAEIADRVCSGVALLGHTGFGRVVNATGVILHTGLGRSQLSDAARQALGAGAGAGNVEVDLETGERRYRGYQLQAAWNALTGAEASLVVNNNAAATLLTLQSLCEEREVVISRGQLVEIGGSFRLPDIFLLSGAQLREVGTTNRTRLSDYEAAIGPETAAIMRVHPSNYRIVGFSECPEVDALAKLAHSRGLFLIDDIGSGCLVDVRQYGLPDEPTFTRSLAAGADLVLGSGDKLLGGPQAGIVLGKAAYIDRVRRHPLARTVRVDKLALAALSATLDAYLKGSAQTEIPTLALLAASPESLQQRAGAIGQRVADLTRLQVDVATDRALVGGGALPAVDLETAVLRITDRDSSTEQLARRLRLGKVRLVPRVQQDRVVIDLRSVQPHDDDLVVEALRDLCD